MKSERNILLFLSAGAMELVWLYAWATFIVIPLLHQPFPLLEAMVIFALAVVLTLLVRERGWRVIMILGFHLFGLMLTASKIVHIFFYKSYPFWAQWWLWESFRQPKEFLEWFNLIVVILWVLFFWIGGVALARRSTEYLTICARFDLGVGAFFFLLMIKFLVLLKGGGDMWGAVTELLLFPFFLFSLLAVAMARNRSSVRREFLSGYRGIGMIVSCTVVVLAFGAGLVLLFLPYLSSVAKTGYGLLKGAATPLGPFLVRIIQFLFSHNRIPPEPTFPLSNSTAGSLPQAVENSWLGEIVEKILEWGFLCLGAAIATILFVFAIWFLFRWLFSQTSKSDETKIQWTQIFRWLAEIWSVLSLCWDRMASMTRGFRDAADLYRGLLIWGRHSGMPHSHSETPREYGLRLRSQLPKLGREIETIAEAFNREVYGERTLAAQQFTTAREAWRSLRSPGHWPSRFKFLVCGGNSTRCYVSFE